MVLVNEFWLFSIKYFDLSRVSFIPYISRFFYCERSEVNSISWVESIFSNMFCIEANLFQKLNILFQTVQQSCLFRTENTQTKASFLANFSGEFHIRNVKQNVNKRKSFECMEFLFFIFVRKDRFVVPFETKLFELHVCERGFC